MCRRMNPCISVIICVYNHSPELKRALKSLAGQTVKPGLFEIIIVDNGSQEDILQICNIFKAELPGLTYVSTEINNGTSMARNTGFNASTGEFILFMDSDCIASKNWVEKLSVALKDEPIVSGAIESPVSNYFQLCHNIAQFHAYMAGRKKGPLEFFCGANMGFRRSVLQELEGFQPGSICEDTEIIIRAHMKGYHASFVPDAVVIHDPPERNTLSSILEYASVHAYSTICLRNRYSRLLHTPFILRSPFLILFFAPLIALKVTAGIYLNNSYLRNFFYTVPVVYLLKLAWCLGASRGLRDFIKNEKSCENS